MNRLLQVARTYWRRPRFWVLAGFYLWALILAFDREPFGIIHMMPLAYMACVASCFLGLHARRQFGSSLAKLTPGFAAAHLAVVAVISGCLWIAVPLIIAPRAGASPLLAIAIHVPAALTLALVVFWRQASLAVAAIPGGLLAFSWLQLANPPTSFNHFVVEHDSLLEGTLIGFAAIAQVVAARRLMTLSDADSRVTDDLLAELPAADQLSGRYRNRLLAWRDAAVERWLAAANSFAWPVRRWRIPVISAREDLALATSYMIFGGFAAQFVFRNTGVTFAMLIMGAVAMIAYPFVIWHRHHNALATQFMRPVSRPEFFRQLALAIAWDVALWSGLALAIVLAADLLLVSLKLPDFPRDRIAPAMDAAVVIGMTVFCYGLALVTFRWKYSIVLRALGAFVWPMLVMPFLFQFVFSTHSTASIFVFAALTAVTGVALAAWAYRRSLSVELG